MKNRAWILVGAAVAVAGCDSEVVGGSGSGGAGGSSTTGDATTAQGTTTSTVAQSTAESTAESTGQVGSSGPGGEGGAGDGGASTGGGNALGDCELDSGTSGSSIGGTTECDVTYTCDAGFVEVFCIDDGTTEVCQCSLTADGSGEGGECVNRDSQGCSFPQNCCFAFLGGEARPNPGPYGACESDGGSSAQSGGGTTACGASYTCEGGSMMIDCEGDASGAVCVCRDEQFFEIGTCRQPEVDCEYETGCCFDIFN